MAAILTTLIVGGYVGWRAIGAEEKIKQVLLARIRPFLAMESDIENVDVDLRSLHLRGVKLAPRDRSFYMEIEEIRLSLNLWNLIKHGFKLHKITHDMVLIRPSIYVRQLNGINGEESEEWLDTGKVVDELGFVERITVTNAEVFFEDSTGERIQVAHSLNGWLLSDPKDSATVRLSGKTFNSRLNNLFMDGKLNLLAGRFAKMHVQIKDFRPYIELPFLLPNYLQITAGIMNGEFFFEQGSESSGFLDLKDGTISFRNANLTFEGVNARSTLKTKDLLIQGSVKRFNGSPFVLSGQIRNIFDPEVDLEVKCSRFDIQKFLRQVLPESRFSIKGTAKFGIKVTGSTVNPVLVGNFDFSNLDVYGIKFSEFDATVGVEDTILTLAGNGTQSEGVELDFGGELDLTVSRPTTLFSMNVQGDLQTSLPAWMKKRVERFESDVNLKLTGELADLTGEINGEMSLFAGESSTLHLKPYIKYMDNKLIVDIPSTDKFRIYGEVFSPFREDLRWDIQAEGMENFVSLVISQDMERAVRSLALEGSLQGRGDSWEVSASASNILERGEPCVMELRLTSQKDRSEKRSISLRALYFGNQGEEIPVQAEGTIIKQELFIDQFEIGDFVTLEGRYPLGSDGQFGCRAKFTDFLIDKLHPVFPGLQAYSGEIRGDIKLTGSKNEPEVDLDLALVNGMFHNIGLFEGNLEFRVKGSKFKFARLKLLQNGATLFAGEAERTQGDSIYGEFTGNGIDFSDVIYAFTGKQIFNGHGSTGIIVNGTIESPRLVASLEIKNGSIGSISFQELTAEVVDSLSFDNDILSGKLSIVKGRLDRSDGLKVLFWGDVYHGKEQELDVSVLAEGNVLGFLPELSGVVQKAHGSGEIYLRLAGALDEWILGTGRMSLKNGSIELASFVKKIDNLNGSAVLNKDERFIKISHLSGNIDGEEFSLTNRFIEEESEEYVPLVINGLGVQVGVLQIVTTGKGIRAHLPGFMEEGEEGWLALEGLDEEDYFIVAGPGSSPMFQGTLLLSDLQLTYPFLPVEVDTGISQTLEFLKRVNWDLRVVPKEDVHYVRSIESPFGNVDADLLLRNSYGEIYLQGIIREDDLKVFGNLISMDGSITVLDNYFKPERITMDYPKGTSYPIFRGRAYTTVTDSMGMPSTVWLTISVIDDQTGEEMRSGTWDNVQFRFTTDNPNLGRTEADLLSALGYSADNITDRAYDALGMQVENMLFRPIFRPIERGIKRHLGLDIVHFHSMFSRNIMQIQTMEGVGFNPMHIFRSTKLTLGKYLTPGLFLIYSGQVQNGQDVRYPTHGIGLRHALSLEYIIRPDLFLQVEYTYDSQLLSDRREDKRIWIKHVFPF
jgi:hypothetical protein